MAKADLHVHSKYSEHPTEWFLQRLGAAESYTEPEEIYRLAKDRGMTFVTINDHNKMDGVLKLQEVHPDDVFTGVEATAYFPEDACKIHILLYGLTEPEFTEVQRLRRNIYDLREYIRERNLAHAVAHATFSVNKRLTFAHLEKLILLFNVFEGRNGGRNRVHNETWTSSLDRLTPERIADLARRHGLEPWGRSPWMKSYIGGSDDHAGLFVGQTYTMTAAETTAQFLDQIRGQRTWPEGRHNDFPSLTFTFYKITYDFSRSKSSALSQSFFNHAAETFFNLPQARESPLKTWIRNRKIRTLKKRSRDGLRTRFLDLLEGLRRYSDRPIDEKIEFAYDQIAEIADAYFAPLLRSLEEDLLTADVVSLVRNLSSAMPGLFLSVPFFSTVRHMHHGHELLDALGKNFGPSMGLGPRKVLWFTDTLTDLNGVSVTLKTIGRLSEARGKRISIVTSLDPKSAAGLPKTVIDLPCLHAFTLPFYDKYTLKIPSFLKSLKILAAEEPEAIFISTPGPIGLFGLLASRLFNVPAVGIYHTDFAEQARPLVEDPNLVKLIDDYAKWFYAAMDEVRVPTREYIRLLEERNYALKKTVLFRRGVDERFFSPPANSRQILIERLGLAEGPILLYAGRISQDKNLDFLLEVFKRLRADDPAIQLVIAGDGPYLEPLRKRSNGVPGFVLAGHVGHDLLPAFYAGADVFVFPSTSDTFGMAIIEAQACGLPAIVSDVGGPQEIVRHGRTGYIAASSSVHDWQDEIAQILGMRSENPRRYQSLREESRRNAQGYADWDRILGEITGETAAEDGASPLPQSLECGPVPAASSEKGPLAVPSRPEDQEAGFDPGTRLCSS